jgi:endonuclease/exonuclease/phosphatase family metal-dependent hydrolase
MAALPQPPPALTVASYNIHKAVGTDLRRDPARTIAVLREIGADLVALQEVDRRFGDREGVLDLARLEAETGLTPVPIEDRRGRRASGWHGNLLLLKGIAVERAEALSLPGLEPRGAIVADLRVAGRPLRVIAAHLGLLRQSRLAQARRLSAEIGGADDRPTLILGDFNEWRVGPGCGLMPIRRGLGGQAAAVAPSFPAHLPLLPLDRILGCNRAELSTPRPHVSPLARRASDHLPMVARLRLPP